MAFDFPPETTQKYLTDEGALKYMVDNNPELSKIEVLVDREEGTKRTVEMKYTTDVSLPGPIKKVMGSAASQSLVMKLSVDTETLTGTMEMIPSQMADKIKISGKVSVEKQGDRWVQRVDGDASVKIFGVGKVVEKFLVEKIQSSTEIETRLRNEYMHSVQKKS
jgi:hypothetical protein